MRPRRRLVRHGLDLLIVDYIQLMQGRGRFDNRQQGWPRSRARSRDSQGAERADPGAAQLGRAQSALDRRPQLSDLRESGASGRTPTS
jgi:replicative DNA helicase